MSSLTKKTLNRIAYRLPRIADLLDKLGGAQYFSKLDLVYGDHQVRMRSSDVSKPAFCTPYGNFEFKVMPFGLCGAPSTFSYLMDQVFAEATTLSSDQRVLLLHFVAIYLDDVCIYSRTIEEHLCHLCAVLERLPKWKLYVKPSKCEWMQRSVEFLGHTVSGKGREVTHGTAAALQNWPEPQSVSDVRRLLGTFGFWREYIPKYAEITAPLVALTAKAVAWHFDFAERASLAHLKRALLMAPVLIHPDSSEPFYVSTDASDFAVGASLEQKDPFDRLRPVAFFSHRLSNAERAYPVHERELLAIVLALCVRRHLLYGSEFEVVCQTDHRPLQHFLTQANLAGRQVRWQQFLSEYNLQVAYVPGAVNTFADGLSRRPDLRLMFIGAVAPYDSWLSRILTAYSQDPIASKLLKTATNFKLNATYRKAHGVLYYVAHGSFRVYVPDADNLRMGLIHAFHSSPVAGHFGVQQVCLTMSQHYYWPDMRAQIARYVAACPVCQRTKATRQPTPPRHPLPAPSRPFEMISLDWLSGFVRNKRHHDSTLNIVDKFSKWAIVIPCSKDMTTTGLLDLLWEKVFCWIGLPFSIIGDRDTRLTAKQMRALTARLQVRMRLSVAYHPQTDGATEKFHSTLLGRLGTTVNAYHSDWEEAIPAALYAYHNTVHTATGYTPHHLLFEWQPRDLRVPLTLLPASDYPDVDAWLEERATQMRSAQLSLERMRQAMITARNSSARAHVYHPDDLVKVSTRVLPLRGSSTQVRKLQPKWIGPFSVAEQVNPGAIRVLLPATYQLVHDTFSVEDVRPWLSHDSHALDPDFPAAQAHPALNPVVQVLDRKKYGRAPRSCDDLLDIPAQYLVLRQDGSLE
jgi:hypothetical protein